VKLLLLVIMQIFLYGCMTSYPNEGVFSAVNARQGNKFDKLYNGDGYFRFNSHRQYFRKGEKEYKALVKALISRLIKNKHICVNGYFVPEQEIGGAEGGHVEALIVCRKSNEEMQNHKITGVYH